MVSGNERVLRARLSDAKFFFDQDRKHSLASRVDGLSSVVYHNKIGNQRQRIDRLASWPGSGRRLLGRCLIKRSGQHCLQKLIC